jgi:hypothetical protein
MEHFIRPPETGNVSVFFLVPKLYSWDHLVVLYCLVLE